MVALPFGNRKAALMHITLCEWRRLKAYYDVLGLELKSPV